jgi:hypothetical protein
VEGKRWVMAELQKRIEEEFPAAGLATYGIPPKQVGFTFKGALVRADNHSRRAMYGLRVTTRATLLGRVAAPAAAGPFLDAVRGAKAQALAQARK